MPAVAQPIRHRDELRILSAQPGRCDGDIAPTLLCSSLQSTTDLSKSVHRLRIRLSHPLV